MIPPPPLFRDSSIATPLERILWHHLYCPIDEDCSVGKISINSVGGDTKSILRDSKNLPVQPLKPQVWETAFCILQFSEKLWTTFDSPAPPTAPFLGKYISQNNFPKSWWSKSMRVNIARGTTDPGYWVYNLNHVTDWNQFEIISTEIDHSSYVLNTLGPLCL